MRRYHVRIVSDLPAIIIRPRHRMRVRMLLLRPAVARIVQMVHRARPVLWRAHRHVHLRSRRMRRELAGGDSATRKERIGYLALFGAMSDESR